MDKKLWLGGRKITVTHLDMIEVNDPPTLLLGESVWFICLKAPNIIQYFDMDDTEEKALQYFNNLDSYKDITPRFGNPVGGI